MKDRPIRSLIIGAHPDDAEYWTAGLAAKYRQRGDQVKYVSVTNGEAGHHFMQPAELAKRRLAETQAVSNLTGIEYEVFDIPDGRLVADLPTRERIITLIREYEPDLIFTHRPNDYHPDHRATGTLVMDASYLVCVPIICPNVKALKVAPVILYLNDRFQKPAPFVPDVVVGIDSVLQTKAEMLHCHTSQFYEWLPYVGNYEEIMPATVEERLSWQLDHMSKRDAGVANRYRSLLVQRYGETEGNSIKCAEVFEVSEYGSPLPANEVNDWFPK
jgi:LmbE family N-acetylglucosaminyl deacetylase